MSGVDCFFQGLKLIFQPGLRKYVIVPLLINAVLFSLMLGGGYVLFDDWVTETVNGLPEWLSFLSWLLWLLFVLAALAFIFFGFTMLANIVAAPFNAVLAVKVEEQLRGGQARSADIVWYMIVTRAVSREFSKILYFLPRLLGLVILTLIPVINVIASPLLILFGAWMMAVEYSDFSADNQGMAFKDLRDRLGQKRFNSLGFGIVVYLSMTIPLVNLLVIPAAVAGGTVNFVRNIDP